MKKKFHFYVAFFFIAIAVFLMSFQNNPFSENTESYLEQEINADNIDTILYQFRNRVLKDAIKMDFNLSDPVLNKNNWYSIPAHFTGGDKFHGMINPGNPTERKLTNRKYQRNLHFNLVWHSQEARPILSEIWNIKEGELPNITGGINYPEKTLIVQFEMVPDELRGAFNWSISADKFGNTSFNPAVDSFPSDFKPDSTQVWMKRISMAYKHPSHGWVYMAFDYDENSYSNKGCATCIGKYQGLGKLVPVGASWKGPHGIIDVYSPSIDHCLEKPFQGIGGHLTSPGNEGLPCVYCHSAAQWNMQTDSLNYPDKLSKFFTGAIISIRKGPRNVIPLFTLNTSDYAYCNSFNTKDEALKKFINSICDDPGDDWKNLDDDLYLTVSAGGLVKQLNTPKKPKE